jgi:hypothetical protein
MLLQCTLVGAKKELQTCKGVCASPWAQPRVLCLPSILPVAAGNQFSCRCRFALLAALAVLCGGPLLVFLSGLLLETMISMH